MRLPVARRYQDDPVFHQIVDLMRNFLESTPDITPTELREAVMLAASMHEMTHIIPLVDPMTRDRYLFGHVPKESDHPGL